MRILVAYGSRSGGTQGLAERIGARLEHAGHQVDVRRGRHVRDVRPYEAVVIGGALYAFRWVCEARRAVTLNVDELRAKPVWLFSSGPLDDSASTEVIAPVGQVARLMKEIGARGHATFGGRLAGDTTGFIASALVRDGRGGDFRDWLQVDGWADSVAEELRALSPTIAPLPSPIVRRWLARALTTLCLFIGLTAIAGGVELVLFRDGASWLPPLSVLEGTPFRDFAVPGGLLFCFVGVPNLVAAVAVLRRRRWSGVGAIVAGGAISIWIAAELTLLRAPTATEAIYLGLGLATVGFAGWLIALRRLVLKAARDFHSPFAA